MKILTFSAMILLTASFAWAVPTFQVYIPGATAGDLNGDEETWITTSSSFNVVVVGAFGPNTQSLTNGTLLLSVPQGQTGSITIAGATLLTTKTLVSGTTYNPNANADIDILGTGSDNGYSDKDFLPDGTNFNNHYPFQAGVSDFLIYNIGNFQDLGSVHNYNADDGTTSVAGSGQEKSFAVTVSGFDWVHFDAYGLVADEHGQRLVSTWEINPGSHDATSTPPGDSGGPVPAPGALLLGSLGIALVGKLRARQLD